VSSKALEVHVDFDSQPLHSRVHAAVDEYRDDDGWWSDPLETAMVAVADAQHLQDSRTRADEALELLTGWLEGSMPRPIGADAAAAALTARAALLLHGGRSTLTDRATELVSATCRGATATIAPLHLALAAWALDPVVESRSAPPWDDIRTRLSTVTRTGLNGALADFAVGVADQREPPLPERLGQVDTQTLSERCILLWLLYAAAHIAFKRGASHDDRALGDLLVRRAGLLEHLDSQLPASLLEPESFPAYDPDEGEAEEPSGLGLFEVATLDLALSGTRERKALITLDERSQLDRTDTKRRARTLAAAAVGVGALVAAQGAAIGILAGAETRLWVGTGIALLATASISALALLARADVGALVPELIMSACGVLVVGLFLAVEGALGKQLASDEAVTIIGVLLAFLPPLILGAANRLRK
jgi:hypothetical protein